MKEMEEEKRVDKRGIRECNRWHHVCGRVSERLTPTVLTPLMHCAQKQHQTPQKHLEMMDFTSTTGNNAFLTPEHEGLLRQDFSPSHQAPRVNWKTVSGTAQFPKTARSRRHAHFLRSHARSCSSQFS